MNNNRSHDYENYVNSYGMKEIQSEAKKARMLKDSGISGANRLARAVAAFGSLLTARQRRTQAIPDASRKEGLWRNT